MRSFVFTLDFMFATEGPMDGHLDLSGPRRIRADAVRHGVTHFDASEIGRHVPCDVAYSKIWNLG